jgi:hypothetical protein
MTAIKHIEPKEHGTCTEGWTARKFGDVLNVDIWYPLRDGEEPGPDRDKIRTVEVGLLDVRAADSIRITYDFARDGWRIEQAKNWSEDQSEKPLEWVEVSFIRAWALEPK